MLFDMQLVVLLALSLAVLPDLSLVLLLALLLALRSAPLRL